MKKGRRERIEKGSIVSSSPQGMTSWSSSIKIWFFQAYRMHYSKKDMSWCETESLYLLMDIIMCNKRLFSMIIGILN